MPKISALIEDYRTRTGLSYEKIADAAGATKQTVWNTAHGRLKEWPEPETIVGLAASLECDVTTVVLGYARELGLPVTRQVSGLAALLPPGADRLTPTQEDAVLSVVRVILDAVEGSGGTVKSLPKKPTSPRPAQPARKKLAARQPKITGKRDDGRGDGGGS